MSEEENINQPTEENPPAEENKTVEQPLTDNNQPTTNMEVHKHPHHVTHKKKWGEYLLEFFMLFLAVFLGFVAENVREVQVDKAKEKEYMVSLMEDIKKDTLDLFADIPFWNNYIKRIDTLRNEIKKPASQRDQFLLFRCVLKMRNYDNFNYHDRTIQQLKNGGNFRLIRKKLIADSLIDYDSEIQSELRDMEIQSNSIWQNLNFLQDKLFNSGFFQFRHNETELDSSIRADPEIIKIRTGKEDELFEYNNRLQYFQVINTFRLGANKALLHKATNLIEMIKKEYHLENE